MLKQGHHLKSKKTEGFTLVELIVVIAILVVLSVLAVVAFGNLVTAAQTAAIRSDAQRVATQLNHFNEAQIAATASVPAGRITTTPAVATAFIGQVLILNATVVGQEIDFSVILEPDRAVGDVTALLQYSNGAWSLVP